MKTEFRIAITSRGQDGVRIATRKGTLDFAPPADIEYQSPPWTDGKRPVLVSYILEEATFDVFFGLETHASRKEGRKSTGAPID